MVAKGLFFNKRSDIEMPWKSGVRSAPHAYFFDEGVGILRVRTCVSLLVSTWMSIQ